MFFLFVAILIGSISINMANIIAIKRFKKETPIKSSINIIKYNYIYIILSTISFNYYYSMGISYFEYSTLIIGFIIFNTMVSIYFHIMKMKEKFNFNQLIGILIIIIGVILVKNG